MNLGNQSSTYQPYQSVGALAMVDVNQIQSQQNLDYLQNLCGFIDHMNLNPLWFEQQNPQDRLKVLQIYQLAINYSKNLSQNYQKTIDNLTNRTQELKYQNEEKQKQIRQHKTKVEALKNVFRKRKHQYYQNVYRNLKHKLKQQEERQYYAKKHRDHSYLDQDQPKIVYYQPPHFPHDPHAHYQHPPQMQHPQTVMTQQIPTQVNYEGQVAAGLHNLMMAAANQPKKQSSNSKKPNIYIEDQKILATKKTNKSVLVEKDSDIAEQSSLIIGRHNAESKKFEPIKQSKVHNSRKTSMDKDDDLPFNLMAESKKKQTVNSIIANPQSSHSVYSQTEHYDSIANIKITPGSKIKPGSQDLQSKLSKRPAELPKPQLKVSAINEENQDLSITLPGNSNIGRKTNRSELEKSVEPTIEQMIPKQFQKSKFVRKGQSQSSKNQMLMMSSKPQRQSQMNKMGSRQQKQDLLIKKSSQQPSTQMHQQKPQRASRQVTTDEIRASNNSQDFNLNLNSNFTKNHKGKESKPLSMYQDNEAPIRKSKIPKAQQNGNLVNSRQSDKRVSWLGMSNKQSLQVDDNDDILNSNVGQTPFKATQNEKMFSQGKPQRSQMSGQIDQLAVPNAKQSPRRSEQIKEEEQEYGDDFDDVVVDQESLMKTKNKSMQNQQDQFGKLLENSSRPTSKNQAKQQEVQVQKIQVPKATKQMEKSSVNIMYPSSQSIADSYKYQRLKDEEFKVKQNIMATLKTQTYMSQSVGDPFDFIAEMPANSVIAKRPLLKSQIHKAAVQHKKPSINNIESEKSIGASNHININLINPDNVRETIKNKKDYKDTQKTIELEEKESKQQQINNQGQSLPSIKGLSLESKVIAKKQVNRKESAQQINFKLEDQSKLVRNQNYRKVTLSLIKKFQMAEKKSKKSSKLQDQVVNDALKKICKVNFDEIKSIDEVEKYMKRVEKETEKLRFETDKKKKVIQQVLRDEQLSMYTPPKLQGHSPSLKDSLMYSKASVRQSGIGSDKKIQPKDSNVSMDMVQSVNFNTGISNQSSVSPNIPKIRKDSSEKQSQTRPAERKYSGQDRKSAKSANKYALDNVKNEGKQEKQNLLKNVGEGISKYDQDDELNKEAQNLLKKNKQKEDEYDDDFEQWD